MTQSQTDAELWNSISLDLISVQVEGKIAFINTAGAKMLGATAPEQLLGKPILDFVHPAYRPIAAERIRQVMTAGIVVRPSAETWLRLDGTAMDVEVAAMPICYEGKPAMQLIAFEEEKRHSYRPAHNSHFTLRLWRNHRH